MSATNGIKRYQDRHLGHAPRGKPPTKKDRYDWNDIEEDTGRFMRVPKESLMVDLSYQRPEQNHVTKIAANWDWKRCGALAVAQRPNGEMFIVDGGTRWAAASMRREVTHLPCVVHDSEGVADEADVFGGMNEDRRRVSPYDRYKSGVVAGRPVPTKIKRMVEACGYKVTRNNGEPHTCAAVARLYRMVESDPELAARVFELAARICNGDAVQNPLLMALFWVAGRSEDVFDAVHINRLVDLGQDAILAELKRVYAIRQRGGAKVYGQAIVEMLNKSRRSNRIQV